MKTTVHRCPACGRREKRSSDSNRRYWKLLAVASARLGFGVETLHIYYKSRFLGCDEFVLPNKVTMIIPHSSADLEPPEFSDYMTQVEADLNERDIFLDA